MADNVIADPGAGGATFATDDILGVHYPRSKVVFGADGVATDVSAADPLPVTVSGVATAAAQATLLTELQLKADLTETQPVSLASVPSHPVTNAGVFATQLDGAGLASLQLIDDAVYASDGALNKTLGIGAVFDDVATAAITENQGGYLRMSSRRALLVEGVASGTAVNVLDTNSAAALTALQLIDNAVSGTGFNVSQLSGVAVSMNTGVRDAGTQRVTIATNDAVPVTFTGSTDAATQTTLASVLTAVQLIDDTVTAQGTALGTTKTSLMGGSVTTAAPTFTTGQINQLSLTTAGALRSDLNSIASTTVTTGVGASTAGTQRVVTATDSTIGTVTTVSTVTAVTSVTNDVKVVGNTADDSPASGAPVPMGATARTTNRTAVGDGDVVRIAADDMGRQVTVIGQVRDLMTHQHTQIASSAAETTILTAGAAGVFHDLTQLVITNQTATAVTCTIKDATAGTTRMIIALAASGGAVIPFARPVTQATAANNWTATLSSAAVTVNFFVQAEKNV